MFWLLLTLLLLLSLAALGYTLLSLWRPVKSLGHQVADVGETVGKATELLETAQAAATPAMQPCPTCGAPTRTASLRTPAVRR